MNTLVLPREMKLLKRRVATIVVWPRTELT